MPSLDHESLIVLFRNQPELAAQLLREALHVDLPAYTEARLASSDLTEVVPTEFRADAVVLLVEEKPVLGVIVEAQLSRDDRKRFTWPAYLTVLRARHACPVELLVVAPDRAVAAWAAALIQLNLVGDCVVRPRVLGPDTVPVVTDPVQAAREPELAVLSAMAHGAGDVETALAIAVAASVAFGHLPVDQQLLYFALTKSALGDAARKAFAMHPEAEKIVEKFINESSFSRGQAHAVLRVLDKRGIVLNDLQRKRILTGSDQATLDRWLDQAVTVASADELFE